LVTPLSACQGGQRHQHQQEGQQLHSLAREDAEVADEAEDVAEHERERCRIGQVRIADDARWHTPQAG
jgi:hypothetical protein